MIAEAMLFLLLASVTASLAAWLLASGSGRLGWAGRRWFWLAAVLLVVLTLAPYAQVRDFAFLNYDDDKFLVDNEAIQQGLDAESIRWAFTNNHASLWLPATWISHIVDFALLMVNDSGSVTDERIEAMRDAGFTDDEICKSARTRTRIGRSSIGVGERWYRRPSRC